MARPASRSSSSGVAELLASKAALDQRWQALHSLIAGALGLPLDRRQLRVDAEYASGRAWAGLQGEACERISRNQGGSTWVAPICELPSDLVAWLGWQEVWELPTGQRSYRFRNIGLTVYLGKRHEAVKPQLLRLEWPGLSTWSSKDQITFQSPGAGQPHWQIDIVQSLAVGRSVTEFEPDSIEVVEDFEAIIQEPTIDDLIRRLSVERMHLASAAPWWLPAVPGDVGHHMNAPADLNALSRWLGESITYLRQELSRCIVHA
jgi:hypothetical protein